MQFIRKKEVPRDGSRDITYVLFLCEVRNETDERNQTNLCIERGLHQLYKGSCNPNCRKGLLPSYYLTASSPLREHDL